MVSRTQWARAGAVVGSGGSSTHRTRPADPPAPRWQGRSPPASLLLLCTCWPGAGFPAMQSPGHREHQAWTAPGTDMGGTERRDGASRGNLLLPLTRSCTSTSSVLWGCGYGCPMSTAEGAGWHSPTASSGSSCVSLAAFQHPPQSQHPPVSHHPSMSHSFPPCVLPNSPSQAPAAPTPMPPSPPVHTPPGAMATGGVSVRLPSSAELCHNWETHPQKR